MTASSVLEAQRLGPRLLLGHVVDAEELVVAEQQPVHPSPIPLARLRPRTWAG